jgi:small subunit ribosomal protein S11
MNYYKKKSVRNYYNKRKHFVSNFRRRFRIEKQLILPSSLLDSRRMATIMLRETKNNIFATVVTVKNKVVFSTTAGVGGLRGPKRATPYSAELLGRRVARKLLSRRLSYVDVSLKSDLSHLLKAVFKGFALTSLKLATINDEIAVAHNGIRRKKARRV